MLHTYDYGAALQRVATALLQPVPGRHSVSEQIISSCARALVEDCADYYERAVRASILSYRRYVKCHHIDINLELLEVHVSVNA